MNFLGSTSFIAELQPLIACHNFHVVSCRLSSPWNKCTQLIGCFTIRCKVAMRVSWVVWETMAIGNNADATIFQISLEKWPSITMWQLIFALFGLCLGKYSQIVHGLLSHHCIIYILFQCYIHIDKKCNCNFVTNNSNLESIFLPCTCFQFKAKISIIESFHYDIPYIKSICIQD